MPLRRYNRTPVLRGGHHYGTSSTSKVIRDAVDRGEIPVDVVIVQVGERLDTLAGRYYSDGRLWWIIAAASGIGWAPQVPPGTRLLIPRDLARVTELVG